MLAPIISGVTTETAQDDDAGIINSKLEQGKLSVIRRCSVEEPRVDEQVKNLNEALAKAGIEKSNITKTRMGAGYNGLPIDERVQKAREAYVIRPGSSKYGPFQGEVEPRNLVAQNFNKRYRTQPGASQLTGENVLFTIGSQGGLTFAKKVLTNPGDAVMSLGRYAYPMYKPNIEKVNGVHIGITPSDATNPIPSPQDIEKSINNFLINPSNRGKKVVLLIQTENPLGCSPTEEWAKSVAEVMKNIWKKHGENSLVGIGDGIYDGLSEGGKYYDVADYLPKLDKFVKLKSGAKTFGDVGGPRPGALITENKALLQVLAEQQFIELLSANGEGQWIMAKMMELEVDPKNREQVSEYFEKNTELCLKLGLEMSKKLGLKTSMFEPYEKMKEQGAYRKGGFYLWGNLTEAVSGLQIPESMHEIAGSKTIDCATTWTRLLMNGHLMEGVRKAVVTTPVEDFIVDPKDLIDPASGKYRIEGRFSTSAIRETFRDSFETMERAVCTLLVYNIDKGHPVPDFAKAPQVQAYIREVASRTNAIDKAIQTNPSLQKMQQEMRGEAEKSMNSISWKTAPKMIEAEIDAKAKMVRGDSVRTM